MDILLLLALSVEILILIEAPPIDPSNKLREVSYHWQRRVLHCSRTSLDSPSSHFTECSLGIDELGYADFGKGCFDQFDPTIRNIRNLCSLKCTDHRSRDADADEVTLLSKSPSNNHKCNQFYNYGVVHSGLEWYLWRSGSCLNETVRFEVRCGFPFERSGYVVSEPLFTLI